MAVKSYTRKLQQATGVKEDIRTEFDYFSALYQELQRRVGTGELKLDKSVTFLSGRYDLRHVMACPSDPSYCIHTVWMSPDGKISHRISFRESFRGMELYGGGTEYDEYAHKMLSNETFSDGFFSERATEVILREMERLLKEKTPAKTLSLR